MRRLLLALLLLAIPARAGNLIDSYRYGAGGGGGGSDLAVGVSDCNQATGITGGVSTASLATTAGSTVCLGVHYTTFGGGFEGVSGSIEGGTANWTQVGTTQTTPGVGAARLYCRSNITGGSQTFTLDIVSDFGSICAIEIDGAGTSSVDAGSATYDSAEPYVGTALTVTPADTIRIAYFARNDGSDSDLNATESNGYTLQAEEPSGLALAAADIWTKVVTDNGAHNVSSNDDATDAGCAVFLAAIKD